MSEKKISQIGTSLHGRKFLRSLAGRSENSGAKSDEKLGPSALFNEMKDAYRALLIYGLIKGERLPIKNNFTTIYASIGMLADNYDYHTLIKTFGTEEDLEDIGKSINEYTNWAIEDVSKKFESNNLTIEKFYKLF